jgi:ectoine hydroxylase-related dioxygenase (phytanoyl-CoA dioxygenase family)
MVEALRSDGCVVVTGVTDKATRDAIARELAPHLEKADADAAIDYNNKYFTDSAGFYPAHTKRITGLIAKSETFRTFVTHPMMLAACDAILKPNCESFQLHVGSGLVVGPGARTQVLHREDDAYQFFKVPRPDMVLASMWAISEFTAENGATNLVPGSHRWPEGREARSDEIAIGAMPAGSVLIWMSGTLHGAGANRSNDWRYGVFLSYSLGWLRQEENQYLDVPPALARTLSKELRNLVGYKMHRGLGFAEIRSDDSRQR